MNIGTTKVPKQTEEDMMTLNTKKATKRTAPRGARKTKNVKVTRNRLYEKLSHTNSFFVRTTRDTRAGVLAATYGNKKGSFMEILLPSTTIEGKKRTVRVLLSGRQARVLLNTLTRHYDA